MPGIYPSPGGVGGGLSNLPGQHEFADLLRRTPLGHSPLFDPRNNEFADWLKKQPFRPRDLRPGGLKVPRIPYRPLPLPWKAIRNFNPAFRALWWLERMGEIYKWAGQTPGRMQFPPGWYHHCGQLNVPGECGFKYGATSGHTVDCGTTSQVPEGDYPPQNPVTLIRGPSGAQFHMGRGHLACLRFMLEEVWRIDGPGDPDIARWLPPMPIPDFDFRPPYASVPPVLWPPETPEPPAAMPPVPAYPVPGRSPHENSENGPTLKPDPAPPGWNQPGKSGGPGAGPWKGEEVDGDTGVVRPPKDPPGGHQPPKPGDKEKKWKFSDSRWYNLAVGLMGTITEIGDLIDALFEALPDEIVRKYGQASPWWKCKIIDDQWQHIDANKFIDNLIHNQIEDWFIGKFGAASKQAVQDAVARGYWKSPGGFGFGPAL